jgi:glycosyltransferase involved in cell wall biosynthesis
MSFPSFVRSDIELLQKKFDVGCFHYDPSDRMIPNIRQQIRLFSWLMVRMPRAVAVYVWFADYHAFLPVLFSKILKKQSVVVLGGYDVTYIPELKYGVFSNPIRSFFAAFAIRNAGVLAPVAEELIEKARVRVPVIRGRVVHLPLGFDPSHWYCDTPKEKSVLTVSVAEDGTRLKIKGVDFLIDIARMTPEVPYTVIGVQPRLRALLKAPPNVRFVDGRIPFSELRGYYSRAKVYAQLSMSEGMPSVVCEAMLCECIPVGTKIGGIPGIIGDAGYCISERDPLGAARVIRKAIQAPRKLGENARHRIVARFSQESRYQAIVGIIERHGEP